VPGGTRLTLHLQSPAAAAAAEQAADAAAAAVEADPSVWKEHQVGCLSICDCRYFTIEAASLQLVVIVTRVWYFVFLCSLLYRLAMPVRM
jgi:hypothetical protein